MDINVTFRCMEIKNQITIQGKTDNKIATLLDKFSQKIFADKKDFEYSYNGRVINDIDKEITVMKLINNKNIKDIKEIEILIKKRNKIFKCPICTCNNCIIKIDKYRLNFSQCCKNHNENKLFDEYEDTQRINYQNIKCDNQCGRTQKDSLEEFHKCLDCSNLAGYAIYYCHECNNIHRTKHNTIKYDEKYYYCSEHFGEFVSYCSKCKYNLCEKCEKNHRNHPIIKFDVMNPDVNEIKKKLKKIGEKIEDLRIIVKIIKNKMDGAIKIIEKYYDIANDILTKYETFNSKSKNYQTIMTINYLSSSNKEILQKIDNIIRGNKSKDEWLKKCDVLLEIIESDRGEYNNENTGPNEEDSNISYHKKKYNFQEEDEFDGYQDYEKSNYPNNNIPSDLKRIPSGKNKNNKNKQKNCMIYNKSNFGNK